MIIVIFRSRLNLELQAEYMEWAKRMSSLAEKIPGHISHKGFVAQDGERVTLVEFETEEAMKIWARHPEHVAAKKKGRNSFFSEYNVKICTLDRESAFPVV
ncbi:antibiotic biosynthesis monooxygenase family protein [Solimicrobium silvestre]|uniref:Putative enzyme involved in biosynthesis of extracellular polysaccharide n=1 Tax=Solimicrobium silvestre TaxID=2099400 RepID=A0A2S9H3U7_9BURK|nr:antibiotic biosynthesis monooxygenase [Solimicrobium silvestre]PRC94603.1 putative enzyme involved in biosynthesis of extracellular polysaccharide [Solimicrobium silvestre]